MTVLATGLNDQQVDGSDREQALNMFRMNDAQRYNREHKMHTRMRTVLGPCTSMLNAVFEPMAVKYLLDRLCLREMLNDDSYGCSVDTPRWGHRY